MHGGRSAAGRPRVGKRRLAVAGQADDAFEMRGNHRMLGVDQTLRLAHQPDRLL